jgi:predicted transcriptional regulator
LSYANNIKPYYNKKRSKFGKGIKLGQKEKNKKVSRKY